MFCGYAIRVWYMPEQLADERLADQLEVAQRQVAFVELAVGDPLLDDPRDHAPDRGLVARRERADGRLDAIGEHDQRRLARLRLRARRAGTCGRRPRRPGPASSFARA